MQLFEGLLLVAFSVWGTWLAHSFFWLVRFAKYRELAPFDPRWGAARCVVGFALPLCQAFALGLLPSLQPLRCSEFVAWCAYTALPAIWLWLVVRESISLWSSRPLVPYSWATLVHLVPPGLMLLVLEFSGAVITYDGVSCTLAMDWRTIMTIGYAVSTLWAMVSAATPLDQLRAELRGTPLRLHTLELHSMVAPSSPIVESEIWRPPAIARTFADLSAYRDAALLTRAAYEHASGETHRGEAFYKPIETVFLDTVLHRTFPGNPERVLGQLREFDPRTRLQCLIAQGLSGIGFIGVVWVATRPELAIRLIVFFVGLAFQVLVLGMWPLRVCWKQMVGDNEFALTLETFTRLQQHNSVRDLDSFDLNDYLQIYRMWAHEAGTYSILYLIEFLRCISPDTGRDRLLELRCWVDILMRNQEPDADKQRSMTETILQLYFDSNSPCHLQFGDAATIIITSGSLELPNRFENVQKACMARLDMGRSRQAIARRKKEENTFKRIR